MAQKTVLLMWQRRNWHWCLVHEHQIADGSRRCFILWSDVSRRTLHLVTSTGFEMLQFASDVCASHRGSAAVIDGSDVLITPLQHAIVPPPMAAARVRCSSTVIATAWGEFQGCETLATVAADGTLSVAVAVEQDLWEETAEEAAALQGEEAALAQHLTPPLRVRISSVEFVQKKWLHTHTIHCLSSRRWTGSHVGIFKAMWVLQRSTAAKLYTKRAKSRCVGMQAHEFKLNVLREFACRARHVAWLTGDTCVIVGQPLVRLPPAESSSAGDLLVVVQLHWPGLPDGEDLLGTPAVATSSQQQCQHRIVSLASGGEGRLLAHTVAGKVLSLSTSKAAAGSSLTLSELPPFPEPCSAIKAHGSQSTVRSVPRVKCNRHVACLAEVLWLHRVDTVVSVRSCQSPCLPYLTKHNCIAASDCGVHVYRASMASSVSTLAFRLLGTCTVASSGLPPTSPA